MNIKHTKIKGCSLIEPNMINDSRGYFSRVYCDQFFSENSIIDFNLRQINQNFNKNAYTLRGLHMQKDPFSEMKIVRCIKGKLQDVVVDMREDSETFLQHVSFILSEDNLRSLIVPKSCLHGYLTLTDNTCATYLVDEPYNPDSECGFRFDDKKFNIKWKSTPLNISEKDLSWKLL